MRDTTVADRKNELRTLLDEIKAHPERDHTARLQRVNVLKASLGVSEKA